MNHWTFVAAAYAVTIIGTLALILIAYIAMRRAESALDEHPRR